MNLGKDVSAMLGQVAVSEDESAAPAEEEEIEDKDDKGTETSEEEEQSGEGPAKEEDEKETEEEEEEPVVDPAVAEMKALMAKMSDKITGLETQLAKNGEEEDAGVTVDVGELIDDTVYDGMFEDRGKFVSAMSGIATQSANAAIEKMLTTVPQIATAEATRVVTTHGLAMEFYRSNPELAKFKETVSAVFDELQADNPNMSPSDIIDKKLGPATMEKLGFVNKQPQPDGNRRRNSKANVAPAGGARPGKGAGKETPFQQELSNMKQHA